MYVLEICKDYVGFLRFLDFQESQSAAIFRPFRVPPGAPPEAEKWGNHIKSLNFIKFSENS